MRFKALTDKGNKRSLNEDNYYIDEEINFLWLLMVWADMLLEK